MHRQETLPPFFRKLIDVGWWAIVGAVLGFACAAAILVLRAWMWGDAFGASVDFLHAAVSRGAALGAIYYPLARLTLLEKERPIGATIAACLATIVFGLVGLRFAGPEGAATVAASVGFWGTCGAIYRNRFRDRNRADFSSYFR